MKLVEKKCPNCGANLEFGENDRSCKCSYCNRSFEIERDTTKEDLSEQFDLKPVKFTSFVIGTIIFITFLLVFVFIFSIGFQILKNSSNGNMSNVFSSKDELVSSVSDLSNSDISTINFYSKMHIKSNGEGTSDTSHSYSLAGEAKREKLYVAYKDNSNYIIVIYRALYHDFFHQENQFSVYVPVVFENVNKDVVFSLGDGEVKAPEYYFNAEKTSYVYGYSSFEEAYNNVVKPLESDYKITEK